MPKPYKLPKTVSRHHPDLPIRINKNKIRIEESKSQMALPAVNLLFFFVLLFVSNFLPAFLGALQPEMKPCKKPLGTAGSATCRGWPEAG